MFHEPADRSLAPPLGIEDWHLHGRARWRPWLAPAVLAVPLIAALLGFLGGSGETTARVVSPLATMEVETPGTLRSGNWFETRVIVEPRADVTDLTIAVDQRLWRGMSIDTVIPDAEKVEAIGGGFAYSFGAVKAGERFVMKVDGQIQPRGLRKLTGAITLRDGERPLATVPLSIWVLP